MSRRKLAVALACLGLALGAPALAMAQKRPEAAGSEIVIRVCNNTNDNARVALSYQPIGNTQFYNEGWYRVQARSCEDLARTDNAYIYGYAEVENDGSRYWAGDHPLCVEYPGPYAFWTAGTACERGQELRNFVAMRAEEFGVYVWTLDL